MQKREVASSELTEIAVNRCTPTCLPVPLPLPVPLLLPLSVPVPMQPVLLPYVIFVPSHKVPTRRCLKLTYTAIFQLASPMSHTKSRSYC